ncbi:hypothetical protein DFH07DRAFT_764912 [Mycena maculata]|uniref:Uncharacterized protein n=1 Tax=Mycena maculata TaxID=230809 RepID=A0AAD7KCL1_9AGAR|nr:hypothetical protein DFH07DRAFT_764912 [Mycena maculata]
MPGIFKGSRSLARLLQVLEALPRGSRGPSNPSAFCWHPPHICRLSHHCNTKAARTLLDATWPFLYMKSKATLCFAFISILLALVAVSPFCQDNFSNTGLKIHKRKCSGRKQHLEAVASQAVEMETARIRLVATAAVSAPSSGHETDEVKYSPDSKYESAGSPDSDRLPRNLILTLSTRKLPQQTVLLDKDGEEVYGDPELESGSSGSEDEEEEEEEADEEEEPDKMTSNSLILLVMMSFR